MGPAQTINAVLRRVPAWPIYVVALLPPAWLFWQGAANRLGADPVKAIEHELGLLALKLVIAGLCITPLRRFAGVNLIRYRRAIGLSAFFYVVLHLLVWIVLDMGLLWSQALADIVKRPYVLVGMAGLVAMIPLAATSNNWSVRRLGAVRWQRLHRLTYLAAAAGAVHFLMVGKVWTGQAILYAAVILGLLALRLIPKARPAAAVARGAGPGIAG